MKNTKVLFLSDNMAVVHMINKQSCQDKTSMVLKFNILFEAEHIPGKTNVVADSLSRLLFQKAHKESPWLDPDPVLVPSYL